MSKTRRQRAIEHPGKPKRGVRDPNRIPNPAAQAMGKLGGLAPHKSRGLQAASPELRKEIQARGVKAAIKARKLKKEERLAQTEKVEEVEPEVEESISEEVI